MHRYGDFFPIELSPFGYNETIAQEYYNLDSAAGQAAGYLWKEAERKDHAPTLHAGSIPSNLADVTDEITKEVIECEHKGGCKQQCTTAFRVLATDLAFYRQHNLPLPTLCPNCRHYERLARRNPRKLWERRCDCSGSSSENNAYKNTASHPHGGERCANEFETPYASDRPEIVYCEQCYQAEVS